MHLINARTYKLEYFVGAAIPKYAILSHVWGKDEVLFHDLSYPELAQGKEGFIKIELTCKQALHDGLEYAWVDTCCINKESSAELSEAINSMYRWYLRATRCYAYLSDLRIREDSMILSDERGQPTDPPISTSQWFTRGWTLQELIAPPEVYFYDREWKCIGTKRQGLLEPISEITGVDAEVLRDSSLLRTCTVAKRMSWAAKRMTTRKEDEAYCLLGVFDVNIPMLYGEEEGAFERLQHEIIRKTTDQSILAHDQTDGSLLALSPRAFAACGDIMLCEDALSDDPYEMTNAGLQIKLPLLTDDFTSRKGVLNCHKNYRRLAVLLEKTPHSLESEYRLNRDGENHLQTLIVTRAGDIQTISTARALVAESQDILIVKGPRYTRSRKFYSPLSCRLWVRIEACSRRPALVIEDLWPPKCWDLAKPNTHSFEAEEDTHVTRALKFSTSSPSCSGCILFSIRGYAVYIAAFFKIPPAFEVFWKDRSNVNLHFFRLEKESWLSSNLDAKLDMHRWSETISIRRDVTFMNFNVERWTIEARMYLGLMNENTVDYIFEFQLQ